MKYYILRTNSVEENLKNTNGYNFKINNLNAERLISDAKDGDIFYLLYNISEKRFIEKGVISSVKSNLPSNKFKALFDSFDGFYQIQVLNSTVGYQEAVAAKSSLSSIKQSLELITKNGIVSIAIYRGHNEGKEEENCIINFAKTLPKNKYGVMLHECINRSITSPLLMIIEKK